MKLIYGIIGVILLQIFAQVNGQDIDPNFCRGINQPFGAFPHPNITRCDLFVVCAMYMPFLQECPADTIFVPHLAADPPYGECEPGKFKELYQLLFVINN